MRVGRTPCPVSRLFGQPMMRLGVKLAKRSPKAHDFITMATFSPVRCGQKHHSFVHNVRKEQIDSEAMNDLTDIDAVQIGIHFETNGKSSTKPMLTRAMKRRVGNTGENRCLFDAIQIGTT